MKEIEVKILEIDRKKVEKKLIGLGAKKVFDGEIVSKHYDFPDHSIRNKRDHLRLRKEGQKNTLTFKKFVEDVQAKIQEELEVEVSDFERTDKILEALRLSPWWELRKHRISYRIDSTRFEFDKYQDRLEHIPEFLEIEAPSVEILYEWVEKLGYKRENCKNWDAEELAEYYSKLLNPKPSSLWT